METTYISKVIFIGDSRSGKTSIIKRYQDDEFNYTPQTTIGVDFTIKEIEASKTQPNNIKMQIWDTAGQERFESVVKLYFKSAYAIVIVFDLTNSKSFRHIINWVKTVRKEYEPEMFIVVGNKSDLEPVVSREFIHSTLAHIRPKFEYTYLETSAKKNVNIEQIFTAVINDINEKTREPTGEPNIKNPNSLKKVNTVDIADPQRYNYLSSLSMKRDNKIPCCSIM